MITNINQRAKELYEFNASNLGGGMFYNNFVVFNHGNNLYSVRNTNTGVISLTKADCAMNAIEKINGDTEESTDERSDYSDFELWAYERYKLEWCVQHNVLPKDVDEEVGINGGECYVCINEFIDNEFVDYNTYFHKCYVLENLLCWISKNFENSEVVMEDVIHMTREEISTYTGGNVSLNDNRAVFNLDIEEREKRVDELLKFTFSFLKKSVEQKAEIKKIEESTLPHAICLSLSNGVNITLSSSECAAIERVFNKTYFREDVINRLSEKKYDVRSLQSNDLTLLNKIIDEYTDERYESDTGSENCVPWYVVLEDVIQNHIKDLEKYKEGEKANDIAKYALEVANFEDDAVTLNTYSSNDDFFYKKFVVEKSWLVEYLYSQNITLSALLYSPEFEKTFKIYEKASEENKLISEVNVKITKELIRHGLSSGYIKLRYENARTVFFIHEGNYNFVSENAKGKKPEEFKKIMSLEEIVDEIFKVLESTRTSPHYEDKFAYMFDLEYCLSMFQSTLFVIGVLEEANYKYSISEGRIDVFSSPDGKLKMYINILFDENNSSTRIEINGEAFTRNEIKKKVKSLTE